MPQCTIRYMFRLVQGRGRMARLHVEAQGVSGAAAEVVWELVANADSYHEWGPWSAGGYENLGDPGPDDAGVIRWVPDGGTTTGEKILESERGRPPGDTVGKGIPGPDYPAEGTLSPEGGG